MFASLPIVTGAVEVCPSTVTSTSTSPRDDPNLKYANPSVSPAFNGGDGMGSGIPGMVAEIGRSVMDGAIAVTNTNPRSDPSATGRLLSMENEGGSSGGVTTSSGGVYDVIRAESTSSGGATTSSGGVTTSSGGVTPSPADIIRRSHHIIGRSDRLTDEDDRFPGVTDSFDGAGLDLPTIDPPNSTTRRRTES